MLKCELHINQFAWIVHTCEIFELQWNKDELMVHAWFLRHLIFVDKFILLSIFCFHDAIAIIGKLFLLLWGLMREWKVLWGEAFVLMQLLLLSLQWTFPSCNINNNVAKTFAIVNLLSQFNHTTYFNLLQFGIFLLLCNLLQFAIASTTTQFL